MPPRVLYLEPFDGGSHAAFTRTLTKRVRAQWTTLTLPGRHWKWRMRGAAAYWALHERAALEGDYDLLWASAYVPLAELAGLVPALHHLPKVLYFHENQLTYPMQAGLHGERDHHFGVTQLVSGLAADRMVFNSAYNRDGFLSAGRQLLARMPDRRPPGWIDALAHKSEVLPVPLDLPPPPSPGDPPTEDRRAGPIILWNHRWEHDKAPDEFAEAILHLHHEGLPMRVALCGQRFARIPAGFERLRATLGPRMLCFGEAEARSEYEGWLGRAHLAVSTARHEFFGVAMLEAAHFGACPLVPDDLAYPELFDAEYRYPRGGLVDALRDRVQAWLRHEPLRADRRALTAGLHAPLWARYEALLESLLGSTGSP